MGLPSIRRADLIALPAFANSGWWAMRSLRRLRRPGQVLEPLPLPPVLPDRAGKVVKLAMTVGRATCLERSRVLQAWEAAHGRPYEVVIGVRGAGGFQAHAWLEREQSSSSGPPAFEELTRLPAPDDLTPW